MSKLRLNLTFPGFGGGSKMPPPPKVPKVPEPPRQPNYSVLRRLKSSTTDSRGYEGAIHGGAASSAQRMFRKMGM